MGPGLQLVLQLVVRIWSQTVQTSTLQMQRRTAIRSSALVGWVVWTHYLATATANAAA